MGSDNSTDIMDRRRMSDAWYKKVIIQVTCEFNLQNRIEMIHSDKVEQMLERMVDVSWKEFTKKWSSTVHTDNCNHKGNIRISHSKLVSSFFGYFAIILYNDS